MADSGKPAVGEVMHAADISRTINNFTDFRFWVPVYQNITSETFWSVFYGNGKYLAGGSNGVIAYSLDGSRWSQIPQSAAAEIGDGLLGSTTDQSYCTPINIYGIG